jgi:hypothetical protein
MGMYDIITVKDKLPWTDDMWAEGLPNACTEFQTKDLMESLANYKIENGRLFIQKYKEVKQVGMETCNGWGSTLQRTGEYWEDTNYHGKLSFYDYASNDKIGNNDCWVEFVATFTNGQVDKIEVSKFEKNDNTERIEKWNQVLSEMLHERKRWINRFFFHTKPVRWARRRIHEALYYIGDFFTRLSYKF